MTIRRAPGPLRCSSPFLGWLGLVVLLGACAHAGRSSEAVPAGQPDARPDAGPAPSGGGDAGSPSLANQLLLAAIRPAHGPYSGGNAVHLRGRGFAPGLELRFGSHTVPASDMEILSDSLARVTVPPGAPGPVSVVAKLEPHDEVVLVDGYVYDAWYLDPPSGPTSGGTPVRLIAQGELFDTEGVVFFGDHQALDLTWITAGEAICRTPPGRPGPVDVRVTSAAGSIVLQEGFLYFESSDPQNGGLGGGPLAGTLEVTVLDATTRAPLPEAVVVLEVQGALLQGVTGSDGRFVFQETEATPLRGQVSLTASHAPVDVLDDHGELLGQTLYQSVTIVAFDANAATLHLRALPPPSLGGELAPAGRYGGYVEGELVFRQSGEFGLYEWQSVPDPRDENEVKVALVYSSLPGLDLDRLPVPRAQVFPSYEFLGQEGYTFRFYDQSGTFAVYAMAGLATVADPDENPPRLLDFVPYVMGIARGVVLEPGGTVRQLRLLMDRQLNRQATVVLANAPPPEVRGPNVYRVDVAVSLGLEGYIRQSQSTVRSRSPSGPFFLPGWFQLDGALAGASYTIVAGAWTQRGGTTEQNPWSVVVRQGVTDLDQPIVFDDFLAVPRARDPLPGGTLGPELHLAWDSDGGVTPDFTIVTLERPTGIMAQPLWLVVVRGGVSSYDLPDLSQLAGFPDLPQDNVIWQVQPVTVPGLDFDRWSYRYLQSRYWSAHAADTWYIRLRQ